MARTAIIMSSYNGMAHIKEQIESLLAQTKQDITIFIRDDGSKDGTFEMLKNEYGSNANLRIFSGENLGFGNSFSTAIRYALADEACFDYFAFCDQDDYWLPDKIDRAEAALSKKDQTIPLLFSHNYYICDEALQGDNLFSPTNPMKDVTFQNMFFEGVFPGFTIVINRTLAKLAFLGDTPADIFYHDKWVSLIALSQGDIIYDTKPLARYRRYEAAASSTNKGPVAKLKWRIDNVLNGNFCPRTSKMLSEYRRLFYNTSSLEIKEFLNIYTSDKKTAKLFYKARLRRSFSGEILIRFIILLGKI